MPELPEVERARRRVERLAEGRTIVAVDCADDTIVFRGVAPAKVEEALVGRRVEAVERRGKYLWFALDRRPWPLFHFGMTGSFRVRDEKALPLISSPGTPEADWPPRFAKIHLRFDDGGETVMTNARRLGRIRLLEDPPQEPPVCALGFDPLLDLPGAEEFAAALGRRKRQIKGLLLDQGFAAGVGNWIADEVLYQARIDPRRRACDLAPTESEALRTALASVIDKAVAVDAEKARFPGDWLFHRRWGRQDGMVTAAGEPIEHITVAGRTTAWVPSIQG